MAAAYLETFAKIDETLKEISEKNGKVLSWVHLGSHRHKSYFHVTSFNSLKKEMKVTIENEDYLSHFVTGSAEVHFYSEEFGLFWSSVVKRTEGPTELVLTTPYHFRFENRRDNERLELNDIVTLRYLFNGDVISRRCQDFSLGGCSLVIKATEKDFMPPHQVDQIQIEYRGKKKVLNVNIVSIEKLKPYELSKYPYSVKRIRFKFIEKTQNQELALYEFFDIFKNIS